MFLPIPSYLSTRPHDVTTQTTTISVPKLSLQFKAFGWKYVVSPSSLRALLPRMLTASRDTFINLFQI
jgi:hypothetical protein